MKITDRFKGIAGIESTHWDGSKLIIYYHKTIDLDIIKARVADVVGEASLQGAFEITLLSY